MRGFKYLLILCGIMACNQAPKMLSPIAYQAYCNNVDNGLSQVVEKRAIKYSLRYISASYQALKMLQFKVPSKEAFNTQFQSTKGHHYLHLQIESRNSSIPLVQLVQSDENWEQVKSHLFFHYQKQLKLWVNGRSVPCQLYHAYGLNNDQRIDLMMVFKDEVSTQTNSFVSPLIFEFDDQHFGNGIVQISFDQADLNQLPDLKI